MNSVNPFRIEGQKTGAFELVEQLDGEAPDILAIPVGNAGNITAYWKGFKEYHEKKVVNYHNYLVSKQKARHQSFKIRSLKSRNSRYCYSYWKSCELGESD